MLAGMPIVALLLQLSTQPVGPVTPCPLVVDVVDPGWMPLPGAKVTIRDERTGTTQSTDANADGIAKFTVQSCADRRCSFTISAELTGFKTVTLKRLWFGASENNNTIRRVQIRLADLKGPKIVVY